VLCETGANMVNPQKLSGVQPAFLEKAIGSGKTAIFTA